MKVYMYANQRARLLALAVGLVMAAVSFLPAVLSSGSTTSIRQTRNLKREASLAKKNGVPLMVVLSENGCPYCELLEREILLPMIGSGEYGKRVRLVMLNVRKPVVDFNGRNVEGSDLASRYGEGVTPTTLFLDYKGRELSERIVGVPNVDYMQYYIDQALKISLHKLRAR